MHLSLRMRLKGIWIRKKLCCNVPTAEMIVNRPYSAFLWPWDLLHVDGLPTRAGSQLSAELLAGAQGSLVTKLRALGAVIAGKTVTEEFAYNGPIATLNPHNTAHTPGGSSAGSAAAVAAGLCPLAVGTQTLRSVIAPASFCGVVGFKPSYGRVPLDGVLLFSPSFDTVGFFTQNLPDMEAAVALLVPDWEAPAAPIPVSRFWVSPRESIWS